MWAGKIEELNQCNLLTEETRSCVLEFIKNNDMHTLANGRYDLGKNNYVNIFEYVTKESDGVFEAHKAYIDIHYVIVGKEKILYADEYRQETKPYQADGDYSLGIVNAPKELELRGALCVFMPDEPHKAGIILNNSITVKKAVFKIMNKNYKVSEQ